jgi:hypothetical protein
VVKLVVQVLVDLSSPKRGEKRRIARVEEDGEREGGGCDE